MKGEAARREAYTRARGEILETIDLFLEAVERCNAAPLFSPERFALFDEVEALGERIEQLARELEELKGAYYHDDDEKRPL